MGAASLDVHVKRYGSESLLPVQRVVHAGPLTVVLEEGDLRFIRLGTREVLRRVYVAVRGPNWETIAPAYTNVRLDSTRETFSLSFDAAHVGMGVDFSWHGTIRGDASGTITYTMDGRARRTFRKNRIGFCVLHPLDCAGASCTVQHADGSIEDGAFPLPISPHQPFKNLVAITHDLLPGMRASVVLDGEVFEMEDQRNWTDASFKTYGTPLHLPYPVEIEAGTRVTQEFTLTLLGSLDTHAAGGEDSNGSAVSVQLEPEVTRRLPRLGVGTACHGRPLLPQEVARLRALHLTHLRVDLDLGSPSYKAALRQASQQARALGADLEVAVFLSDEATAELADLAKAIEQERPAIARWLIFHQREKATAAKWVRMARAILAAYGPEIPIGGGSNAYFTELNRNRPQIEEFDVVSYSINPQVHAFDNTSLVETLAAQQVTLHSARLFSAGKPIAISPVTLRPRFNPDATGPVPVPGPEELPPQVDARQLSLFGAAWTVGSLKYLAEGGAASATYYETTGWRGLMESVSPEPRTGVFPSFPGMIFPLYHVLADVGEFAEGDAVHSISSDSLRVECLALRLRRRMRLLVANLTDAPCQALLSGLAAPSVLVRQLDEVSYDQAVRGADAFGNNPGEIRSVEHGILRLDLLPYAVARVDGAISGYNVSDIVSSWCPPEAGTMRTRTIVCIVNPI